MRVRLWLACLALGTGLAVASDPPGYPRALIGHVRAVVPQGIVVDGVSQAQIHVVTPYPAGVISECFAAVGGTILVRGLEGNYQAGQKIQIMVALQADTFPFALAPTHSTPIWTCHVLSNSLAFPVDVAWDPSAPDSSSISPASLGLSPAPQTPGSDIHLAPTPSSNWSPGSMNDPVGGTHH